MSLPLQAVVMAAGKGTRMKSARAKVLHEAAGLPLLEHVLRALADAQAAPVAIVVGHQADAVQAAFGGHDLRFVLQDPPRGTGHAVQAASAVFAAHPDRTLLVLNGDLPLLRPETLKALLDQHAAERPAATLLTVELPDAGAYGRVLRHPDGRVRAIVEAKDASAAERAVREINVGVYAFAVGPLLEALDRLTPQNAQGEYYLTDVVALLDGAGHAVRARVTPHANEALGVNSRAELAEAAREIFARRARRLMDDGVTIESPETVCIGPDARVEKDATLRPGTLLEGRTVVGAGAVIGPFARLVDAEIGADAQVLDHCLLRECVVAAGASVGPFAHIRPESRIGRGAKVGNFVELKKTTLGEGAKVPHLSYIGDATVGARANIGAGTITCNYDGETKHPTLIGEGAFVGSDTTLVAPVSVGAGAYVAAGSAITADVPADALAVGRSRQVVKEGWAAARRARRGSKPADPPADSSVPGAADRPKD